ncbi:hypothetical protein VPH35_030171 [Triticum aestivum]
MSMAFFSRCSRRPCPVRGGATAGGAHPATQSFLVPATATPTRLLLSLLANSSFLISAPAAVREEQRRRRCSDGGAELRSGGARARDNKSGSDYSRPRSAGPVPGHRRLRHL